MNIYLFMGWQLACVLRTRKGTVNCLNIIASCNAKVTACFFVRQYLVWAVPVPPSVTVGNSLLQSHAYNSLTPSLQQNFLSSVVVTLKGGVEYIIGHNYHGLYCHLSRTLFSRT